MDSMPRPKLVQYFGGYPEREDRAWECRAKAFEETHLEVTSGKFIGPSEERARRIEVGTRLGTESTCYLPTVFFGVETVALFSFSDKSVGSASVARGVTLQRVL